MDWLENLGQSVAAIGFTDTGKLPEWWELAINVGRIGNSLKWGLLVVEGLVLLAAVLVGVWQVASLFLSSGDNGKVEKIKKKATHAD